MPEGPVTPASLLDDLESYIELLTEAAETRGNPLESTRACEDLSSYYRALGICRLSGDTDVDGFFHHLIQSALTRRHYLEAAAAAGGGDPRYRRASLVEPVLDAIAARQWRLAGTLFGLVAHTWTEGEEYEDDFSYAEFLRRLVAEPSEEMEPVFTRWEEVLDGGPDKRLDVARSLHAKDSGAFTEALTELLASVEKNARALADPVDGTLDAEQPTFFPNRWISVEGLALLAIAERQGLDVSAMFEGCPPLAREARFGAFRSRGYPHVSYTAEQR